MTSCPIDSAAPKFPTVFRHLAPLFSLFLAGCLFATTPVLGGPASYDINRLLDEPHPFADGVAPPSRPPAVPNTGGGKRNAVTLFGGVMADNDWQEIFEPGELGFRKANLVGIAASREIWRINEDLSFEIEGQIGRYFGNQDNWEFNLPFIARWKTFPWDHVVDTGAALGVGPSFASSTPSEEVAREGSSQRWMIYWVAEFEFAPPNSDWSGLLRLHHRSGAYGLVAEEGGANVLAVGIRRRY